MIRMLFRKVKVVRMIFKVENKLIIFFGNVCSVLISLFLKLLFLIEFDIVLDDYFKF